MLESYMYLTNFCNNQKLKQYWYRMFSLYTCIRLLDVSDYAVTLVSNDYPCLQCKATN